MPDHPASRPTGPDPLTDALVQHLHEQLTQYPEGDVALPERDGEFASWLTGRLEPGRLHVGVCAREALAGPLAHAVEAVEDAAGVLVVCDVTDDPARGDVDLPDRVDRIEVRRSSQIAGAVVEALAGDVPLVVDVRLSRSEGAALLAATPGSGSR
ncbi:hypothetical protein [Kineococcus sp. SYSU DK002]|uniref:hypothetical protein n=1 Tax=Kineococcus sp. SYSU DK002 TaxID=3383123 RepID=UPI003D7DFBC1